MRLSFSATRILPTFLCAYSKLQTSSGTSPSAVNSQVRPSPLQGMLGTSWRKAHKWTHLYQIICTNPQMNLFWAIWAMILIKNFADHDFLLLSFICNLTNWLVGGVKMVDPWPSQTGASNFHWAHLGSLCQNVGCNLVAQPVGRFED